MQDKHPEPKSVRSMRTRFEIENAEAIAEAEAEQRALRAKKKNKFNPDRSFLDGGATTIYCRRGSNPFPRT